MKCLYSRTCILYVSKWPKKTPFRYILRANNASVVVLGKIRDNKKKKKKVTYLPYVFGDVTGNTHISVPEWSPDRRTFLVIDNSVRKIVHQPRTACPT